MLERSPISATATQPSLRPIRPPSLATFNKNAVLYFESFGHSSEFASSRIPNIFCALRTLCEKHPGVGPVQSPQIAPLRRLLNPMESHCFAKYVRNHFRITLFRKTPGGGGLRTLSSPRIRHF